MAKANAFSGIVEPYQAAIHRYETQAGALRSRISGPGAVSPRLELADLMLDIASHHIVVRNIFHFYQGRLRDEDLNEARKALHRSLSCLEELVSPGVDVSPSENVSALQDVSAERRYRLIRKMGLAVSLLEHASGDSARWKWSLLDFEGRHAAVAKNILDYRNLIAQLDPRSPDYESVSFHLRLLKKLLAQVAKRYREKYELYSHLREDFQKGIDFLNALKRVHVFVGERGEAEEIKKTVDAWTAKLLQDNKLRRRSGSGGASGRG
ncbi:MAG: hypothetical protein LBQ35_06380 [Spirochaetaceae bacterium]|jgi:hypothetical protein|nr:hypothetical protein [Spirochaetaceae bacterium]